MNSKVVWGAAGAAVVAFAAWAVMAPKGEPPADITPGWAGDVARVITMGEICDGEATCQPSAVGDDVFSGYTVRTDLSGRLQLEMVDGSNLVIGQNAEVVIEDYAYEPETALTFVSRISSGALRLVSGKTDKTPERDIRVETPVATTGARGTDYWVGEIDGNFAVLLFEGEVVVTTDAGEAILDEPGEGVTVFSRDQAPGEVKLWPQAKVDRALAAVAFE